MIILAIKTAVRCWIGFATPSAVFLLPLGVLCKSLRNQSATAEEVTLVRHRKILVFHCDTEHHAMCQHGNGVEKCLQIGVCH